VVYLDQFAISNIYKIKSGTFRATSNDRAYFERLSNAVDRALLSQQAIFPPSNIHNNETNVTAFADELRLQHEMLSGDVSFRRAAKVTSLQVMAFAEAFLAGNPPPTLDFSVDTVLKGYRNRWLPDLHITANMSYAQFAPGLRQGRDTGAAEMAALAARWAAEKPSFQEVLNSELGSYAKANIGELRAAGEREARGWAVNDGMEVFEARGNAVYREFLRLCELFKERGVPHDQTFAEVFRFWTWEGLHFLPVHRISSFLFAALARKMASGQKRPPGSGTLNDVRAIATYAPYVDAMIIDSEFANFLGESPLREEVRLKAKIFSMRSRTAEGGREAFMTYLEDLADRASAEVKVLATEFYGVGV
jgi:hypothetical protein